MQRIAPAALAAIVLLSGAALRKRFADEGAEPFRGNPSDFASVLGDELRNWRKVVQDAGIKLD
jgi:tripartite-type tricarboxylate transporter receptor subunit TctC